MPLPDFPCPICGNENLYFYDTSKDEKSGRYKCNECGRDTTWHELKGMTGEEFLKEMYAKKTQLNS